MKDAYYLQLGNLEDTNEPTPQASPIVNEQSTTNSNQSSVPAKDLTDSLNEFMPATELTHRDLNSEEFSDFYDPNIKYDAHVIKHGVIHYPEHWEMIFCPRGRFKKFPPPKVDTSGLLSKS